MEPPGQQANHNKNSNTGTKSLVSVVGQGLLDGVHVYIYTHWRQCRQLFLKKMHLSSSGKDI
jgi:hypothetical protein